MGTSEKFCLRWNDFESNISTAFRELRDDKDFFDVTLVCDEDQIQAHKVILSACSPFFRSVLKRNRHEHPLLYMKGVKYVDIVSVLNFMYHGEVNVAQEELNSFLAVAEDLKVKGLTQNGSEHSQTKQSQQKSNEKVRERHEPQPTQAIKRPRVSPAPVQVNRSYQPTTSYTSQEEEIQEIVPIKTEPVVTQAQPIQETIQSIEQTYIDNTESTYEGVVADPNTEDALYGDEYADYEYEGDQSYHGEHAAQQNITGNVEGTKELDALVEQMMSKTVNLGQTEFVCNVCKKVMKKRRHMMCHVETHIEGVTHVCNICSKVFKTRNSLDKHKHTYHKGEHNLGGYAVNLNHSSTF